MCGRFTFSDPSGVAEAFGLTAPIPALTPRYNVAPSQTIAGIALRKDRLQRGLALLKWGLVPSWSTDPKSGIKPINARSDRLDKAPFREAFDHKRCLIPADGFFEWHKVGNTKRATHFRMKDRSIFAFAGLWEFWTDGTEKLATCCIITTDANALVGTIHNRMPVIVPKTSYWAWLLNETPPADLYGLLRPYPAEEMEAAPVGMAVNKVANEGPTLIEPA